MSGLIRRALYGLLVTLASCAPALGDLQTAQTIRVPETFLRLAIGEPPSFLDVQLSGDQTQSSLDNDALQFHTIRTPASVELPLPGGSIKFSAIGGDKFPIDVGVRRGKLWSIELNPQDRLLSIDEAWAKVEELGKRLTELGFAAGPEFDRGPFERFAVQPTTYAAAKQLLRDDTTIAEMGIIGGEKGNIRVGVSVWSSWRKGRGQEPAIGVDGRTPAEWRILLQAVDAGNVRS